MEIVNIEYKGYKIINSNKVNGWFMTECESVCGESIEEVMFDIDSAIIERCKDEFVTVYFRNGMSMGVGKMEGRLKGIGTQKWAQYNAAPFVKVVKKRCRNISQILQSYNPYLIILEGVGHPDPDDGFIPIESSVEGLTVKRSKYMCCDPRWEQDSDSQLDVYLEQSGAIVIGDYRYTKGYSSYTGKTNKTEVQDAI